jgi:2-polyprenyl-3-methyl-5-hydroxy-6-metoxy-1,4-benzoquinol methylase
MAIFRINHNTFEKTFNAYQADTLESNEWETTSRLDDAGWTLRYNYEAKIILDYVESTKVNTILELGSGPGILSQKIQKSWPNPLEYHLVDKPFAKKYFDEHNFAGKFFVKDFSIDLDTEGLLPSYDLIICNDTLEHLLAPTLIVKKVRSLLSENGIFFVSVPNWRMAHQFLYRGLWDYDNFLYFMYIHGFNMDVVYPSVLQTPDYPRLSSEECMVPELMRCWNWYFVMKKREL